MKTITLSILYLFTCVLSAQTINISGTITDNRGEPFMGVNIFIDGTSTGVLSDFNGNYSIDVEKGQELVYSYQGLKTQKRAITSSDVINIILENDIESLGTVLIQGTSKRRDVLPYAVSEVSGKDIQNKSEADVARALIGKIPGARIMGVSGTSGSGTNFTIRSNSSINGDNQPLYVVDGMPISTSTNTLGGLGSGTTVISSRSLDLDPNNIEKVQVLRGLSASVLYGQDGRNGVVLITTKTGSSTDVISSLEYGYKSLEEQEQERIELANERTFIETGYRSPYQFVIKDILNSKNKFETYLSAAKSHGSDAVFYLDVYDRLHKIEPELADKILLSYVNVSSTNRSTLNALAFKLEEQKKDKLAAALYDRNSIIRDNFSIESEGDMKILVDLNRDDVNFNLQVVDPNLDVCSSGSPKTRIGGEVVESTHGTSGLQMYTVENMISGSYYIKIMNSADLELPTFMKVTVFRNYGRKNQTKEITVMRIDESSNQLQLVKRIAVL